MSERTVTIRTGDQGVITIEEPVWCTEEHTTAEHHSDISHYGPDIMLTSDSDHGPRELLTLVVGQHPYTDLPPGTGVHMAVRLADGYDWPYDAAGLLRLADDLTAAAQRVREEARRFAALTGGPVAPESPAGVLASMAARLAEQASAGRPPWNDITPDSSDRAVTFEQAAGRYVVRVQAAVYTGRERQEW